MTQLESNSSIVVGHPREIDLKGAHYGGRTRGLYFHSMVC